MKKIYIIIFSAFLVLSAQTVEQIKKQLQDAGVDPNQAKQMARDQDYSDPNIKKQVPPRSIDFGGQPAEPVIKPFDKLQDKLGTNKLNEKNIEEIKKPDLTTKNSTKKDTLEYFGYQIFNGDPGAFQASTFGAVDPNYNIGPGDQIIVMLWGESQFRQEFTIDREGYVFVPEVGQIFVNGLNLEALEKKFFQILSKVYSTLKPTIGKPTTFMDISLGNLRPLRIIVLGDVTQPGAYSVSPSTSLSSSLYYFRGPTVRGSLRDIRLLRKGNLVGNIDFYDYLLFGNTPNDLRLQLDDVVFIKPRGKTVAIYGEINREGIYELKESEGLQDLLRIAGGPLVTAYMNRAQINRIVPVNDRSELGMDRIVIDINLQAAITNKKDTELRDGDVLEIFSIQKMQLNYVTIKGSSVARPGRYQLVSDMRVIDLLNTADGLFNDAFLQIAHIHRKKDDFTIGLIPINLENVFSGDLDHNIKLKFMDELIVYNKNTLRNTFSVVTITGPVKKPGTFNLEEDKKLNDLIIQAGGFNPGIKKVKITVARTNKESFSPILYSFPPSSSNKKYFEIDQLTDKENEINQFILKSNDIVLVYVDPRDKLPNLVNISGSVYYPGFYPILYENEKVGNIIKRAGGLLPEAYPMASTFIRENQTIRLSFDEIIKNPNSKENFAIMPNDQINILRKPNIVKVLGEVHNPGFFKNYINYNFRDYIETAGGLTTNAEKRDIWVTYPDGTSKQLKRFSPSPKIYDGSVITIGKEEDSEPLDKTEFAKEIASIIADFLQIAMTLIIITNTNTG